MADEQEPEELEIDPLDEEEEELPPLTDEAEAYLAKEARREEQGLGQFPFPDGAEPFQKIGDPKASYTVNDNKEVLRIVSSWYVKKANFYHDVTNLQVKYQPHDIKHLIVQRMRETFPAWKASEQTWKDFFKVLLDPPVNKLNPERSIPVWSGKRVCLPSNPQKVIFRDGTATVNIWEKPAYRQLAGTPGSAFDQFITYVIPNQQDREVFLNWLAWNLQNEGKKPSWAVMLYSEKQGTGKSTLTDLLKALFGEKNTGRINGVEKLVGRFNKETLENKLVIVEEVEVKRGSPQANSIKSLITEDSTMVEAKGLPAYLEDIYCAFIMTTNHLPLWLEESDRRFFILNFDHQGYANGGADHAGFARLVEQLKKQIADPKSLKGIYDTLMEREVPEDFGDRLDVQKYATEIMRQLKDLSPDVAKQIVEEVLDARGIVFVPVEYASKIINRYAPREINAQTHLFQELGWRKGKFAWGGGAQKWAWVKEVDAKYPAARGKVWSGHNWDEMSKQVKMVEGLLGSEFD
jgi:hypothetical protein